MSLARLFLSPHLDDVAFSCGATVATAVRAGESCCVATLFSEGPGAAELSAVSSKLHQHWGVPPGADPPLGERRRAEDALAMQRLGVDSVQLGFRDCIYRRRASGAWRIANDGEVFEGMKEEDLGFAEQLRVALESLESVDDRTKIYVPLALGGHVDHELCRYAAEHWRPEQLCYYEDFPYCLQAGALEEVMGDEGRWVSELEPVEGPALQLRVDAARAYVSQLPFLFGSADALETAIRVRSRELAGPEGRSCERFWRARRAADAPRLGPTPHGHLARGGHGVAGVQLDEQG